MSESICFAAAPGPFPRAYDPERATRTFEALCEGDGNLTLSESYRTLLTSAFANSPFLARTALREKPFLGALAQQSPDAALRPLIGDALSVSGCETTVEAMAHLRVAKRRAALVIALADIGRLWTVGEVTKALTQFADACVQGALRFILKEKAQKNPKAYESPAALEASTGLVVLAMGKQGGFELNYSSDIDLIVFYAPERFPFEKRGDARAAAVDIVKDMVRLLGEITSDGYVFRVDLRLRPDAGATQVAISTQTAESYYEDMGQNWERAAMIKARACAGDRAAAADFLHALEPFVWRKNLDYAAIEDIHSIKRQIHAHEGHDDIAVAGHNIKLGRGGIREIEFFAQTQQLIAGGRYPALRTASTLDALQVLRTRAMISEQAERDLREAYLFLRHVEHRLQMIEDEQTHTLPKTPEGLDHIAAFAGFESVEAFSAALTRHLENVSGHYARLFERSAPLAGESGSLVFTGVEDDPETNQTLQLLGYRDASHVSGAIRGWHHGRIRAMRSARARELLTRLVPALLKALAESADPDTAFAQFDRFLSTLPTGVQFFSLLLSNPHLMKLVANITGSAPRLAAHLARSPATFDALLDPGFLTELPNWTWLQDTLETQLEAAADYEAALDAARRFAKEQILRVGAQLIEGQVGADRAGMVLSDVADSVICGLLTRTERELAQSFGSVPGGQFAIIAMGKLGGREMTAASDLDLVFVYDIPAGIEHTDGAKPLPASVFYARLAQRLIAALTTTTAQGSLYEIDMRLRPTGNKGPVAVSLESFARYHASDAWTWERMALTRARVIAAPEKLRQDVEAVIRDTLTASYDRPMVLKDARDMRDRMAIEYPGRNLWDLKFARGGLVDIEFIAQIFQLCAAHATPQVLSINTVDALKRLSEAGVFNAHDAAVLTDAMRLQSALMQVLRIAVDGTLDRGAATIGLKALLARVGDTKDFESLETRLASAQKSAREVFERLLPNA